MVMSTSGPSRLTLAFAPPAIGGRGGGPPLCAPLRVQQRQGWQGTEDVNVGEVLGPGGACPPTWPPSANAVALSLAPARAGHTLSDG